MSTIGASVKRHPWTRSHRWPSAPAWFRDGLIAAVVVLVLAAPALFTSSGFVDDWVNHMWLTWLQSRQIRASGFPSLFVHVDPLGVFYPNFAFYGGTLYAVGGYLMVLTGAPVAVFVGMVTAAIAAAYLGTLWTAREAGVRGLAAHLPALVIVTGAYYLSLAYGRASWPELVATSAIPVIIAATIRIVRRGAAPWSVLALGLATVFWSGSHNLTLAWGTVFVLCLLGVVLIAWAPRLTARRLRRLAVALGVVALGVMVNGWFLLPDVRYASTTMLAQTPGIATSISDPFSRPAILFNPLRVRATSNPATRSHFTELPVLVMAWIAVAGALLWRPTRRRELRRALLLLAVLVGGLLVLIMDDHVWAHVPSALDHEQFTFRLQTYTVIAIAGIVIVAQLALASAATLRRSLRRGLHGTLVGIVLLGLGLACWQVWNSTAAYHPWSTAFLRNRASVLRYPYQTPPTWYVYSYISTFRPRPNHVVSTAGAIHLDPARVHGDSIAQTVTLPPGRGAVATNIAAPRFMVSIRGLRVAGQTADGFVALDRPSNGARTARLQVTEADTTSIRLGRWVTLLGIVGLLGAVVSTAVISRRRSLSRRPWLSPLSNSRPPASQVAFASILAMPSGSDAARC